MRKPYTVTFSFLKNVAGPHRPPRFEEQDRTETIWALTTEEAKRKTAWRFGRGNVLQFKSISLPVEWAVQHVTF